MEREPDGAKDVGHMLDLSKNTTLCYADSASEKLRQASVSSNISNKYGVIVREICQL